MLRPLAFIVALCLLAFGLSACDSSATPTAARVDGVAISQQDLSAALRSVSANAAFACVVTGDGQVSLEGAGGSDTYSAAVAAELLTTLVDSQILRAAAAKLGPVTSLGRSIGRDQATAELTPQSGSSCTGSGQVVLASMASRFRASFISLATARAQLAASLASVELTKAGLNAYAKAHRSATSTYCISAIVQATEPAAAALVSAARNGANFASLARAHSLDKQSAAQGGALGCVARAQFATGLQAAVAKLHVNDVSDPVPFDGAFVILKLTALRRASAADIVSALESSVSARLSSLLNSLESRANIAVDPAYGTWRSGSSGGQVVPPSGPPSQYVANLSALSPPAVH